MPKWVNQCKHGTEVTADSPRARPFATAGGRAESCVYACQLSCHRGPAGRRSAHHNNIICREKIIRTHNRPAQQHFWRRYLPLNFIVEIRTAHTPYT